MLNGTPSELVCTLSALHTPINNATNEIPRINPVYNEIWHVASDDCCTARYGTKYQFDIYEGDENRAMELLASIQVSPDPVDHVAPLDVHRVLETQLSCDFNYRATAQLFSGTRESYNRYKIEHTRRLSRIGHGDIEPRYSGTLGATPSSISTNQFILVPDDQTCLTLRGLYDPVIVEDPTYPYNYIYSGSSSITGTTRTATDRIILNSDKYKAISPTGIFNISHTIMPGAVFDYTDATDPSGSVSYVQAYRVDTFVSVADSYTAIPTVTWLGAEEDVEYQEAEEALDWNGLSVIPGRSNEAGKLLWLFKRPTRFNVGDIVNVKQDKWTGIASSTVPDPLSNHAIPDQNGFLDGTFEVLEVLTHSITVNLLNGSPGGTTAQSYGQIVVSVPDLPLTTTVGQSATVWVADNYVEETVTSNTFSSINAVIQYEDYDLWDPSVYTVNGPSRKFLTSGPSTRSVLYVDREQMSFLTQDTHVGNTYSVSAITADLFVNNVLVQSYTQSNPFLGTDVGRIDVGTGPTNMYLAFPDFQVRVIAAYLADYTNGTETPIQYNIRLMDGSSVASETITYTLKNPLRGI